MLQSQCYVRSCSGANVIDRIRVCKVLKKGGGKVAKRVSVCVCVLGCRGVIYYLIFANYGY